MFCVVQVSGAGAAEARPLRAVEPLLLAPLRAGGRRSGYLSRPPFTWDWRCLGAGGHGTAAPWGLGPVGAGEVTLPAPGILCAGRGSSRKRGCPVGGFSALTDSVRGDLNHGPIPCLERRSPAWLPVFCPNLA